MIGTLSALGAPVLFHDIGQYCLGRHYWHGRWARLLCPRRCLSTTFQRIPTDQDAILPV